MATPTLKQLDAFYWAATCANFSTAAQRLHLSVSSLSKRINELEQVVERTLFDRRNIVGQAVQQIRMQPAQLRGLDERVTDLLSRADHLMNVVLPAALAARPSR